MTLREAKAAGWSGICPDCSPVGPGRTTRIAAALRTDGTAACWRCGAPVTDVKKDHTMHIPEKIDLIITHANCIDGFAAAWAAKLHSPDAEVHFASYGDEPPECEGLHVVIVDFSYPREQLETLHYYAGSLLVLDHHKTAQAALEGLDFAYFDMERSGAGLAWDFLHRLMPRPDLINYVEDRDLWRFNMAGTKAYYAALCLYSRDFDTWSDVADRSTFDMIEEGKTAQQQIEYLARKIAATARKAFVGDVEMWMVNGPYCLVSETAEVLKDNEPALPVCVWSYDGERGDFNYSLRSTDDRTDVSEVARSFGGGGHRNAAGFRMHSLNFGT